MDFGSNSRIGSYKGTLGYKGFIRLLKFGGMCPAADVFELLKHQPWGRNKRKPTMMHVFVNRTGKAH